MVLAQVQDPPLLHPKGVRQQRNPRDTQMHEITRQ